MNSVEERLRAAAHAAARTVTEGSAPELRLPVDRYGTLSEPRRVIRWVAPMAAGLAVVAVVVAVTVLRGTAFWPGPANSQPATAGLPRYFVALAHPGQFTSSKILRTVAIVGNTATGRPIITMSPPKPYDAFVRVTADASGTRYVVAAEDLNRQIGPYYRKTRFYELRITSSGSRTTVEESRLPIPVLGLREFTVSDGIALSPDGTRLAVTQGNPGFASAAVHVYDLATGKARTWVLPAGEAASDPAIGTPSWEANGRYLAIDVSWRHQAGAQCEDCVRLLDTSAGGGNILADSRLLVRTPKSGFFVTWNAALVAPDGSRVLRSAIVSVPVGTNTYYDRPWIYVYNARSGALIRSMTGGRGIQWSVLWSSRDSQSFVVSRFSEGARMEFLTAARFAGCRWHPVPLPPRTLAVAW